MTKITVDGQPGPHGSREDWQNAAWENSNLNAKIRHQIAQERKREREFRATPEGQRTARARELGRQGETAIGRGDLRELSAIKRELASLDKRFAEFARSNQLTPPEREAKRIEARRVLSGTHARLHEAAQAAPGWRGALARRVVGPAPAPEKEGAPQSARERVTRPLFSGSARIAAHGLRGAGKRVGGRGGGILSLLGDGVEGIGAAAGIDALGTIGGIAALPAAATAAAGTAGVMAYESQRAAAGVYGKVIGTQEPYWKVERGAGKWGLASGGSGRKFLREIYPLHGVPQWERQLGVTPQSAEDILSKYGIVPRNREAAKNAITFARKIQVGQTQEDHVFAGMAAGTGIGIERTATTLGLNRENFKEELSKSLGQAVKLGLDRASVLHDIKNILKQNAAAGGFASAKSASDLWMRMASSGMPGARTGALQQGFNANVTSTLSHLGDNAVTAMPMYRAIQAHGGLTTKAQEKAFFGKSYYAKLMSSPGGRRELQDILSVQSPYLKNRYVGDALIGNDKRYAHLVRPYLPFANSGSQGMRDLGTSAGMGVTLPEGISYRSGHAPIGGGGAKPSSAILQDIRAAAKKVGIRPGMLYGTIGGESGFNPNARNGSHIGLGQMGPAALKQIGMSGADMTNPAVASLATAKYLKWLLGQFSSVKNPKQRETDALIAYYWGPGHKKAILAGHVPAKYMAGTDRKLAFQDAYAHMYGRQQQNEKLRHAGLSSRAINANLHLNPSRTASNLLGPVLSDFSSGVVTASSAISGLGRAAHDAEVAIGKLASKSEKLAAKGWHDLEADVGRWAHALHMN